MPTDEIPQIKPQTGIEESSSILTPSKDEKQAPPVPKKRFKLSKKYKKAIIVTALAFLFLILVLAIPSILVYRRARAFYQAGLGVVAATQAQNLPQVKNELRKTETALSSLQNSFRLLGWTKFIPFFGGYTRDVEHGLNAAGYGLETAEILVATIEPYADIIGFTGAMEEEEGDGQKTTEERLDFIIKSLPEVISRLDELTAKTKQLKNEVDQINPNRYPIRIGRYRLREKIIKGIDLVDRGADLIIDGKPLIEAAPYLLGTDEARTYLILFQNDKELRPTGGFITAYSIATVEKGKFKPVSSNDIYNLDGRYQPSVPAPEPIIKYLKGPYLLLRKLRLRDLNWSPDFAESMELFSQEAEKVGIDEIDGIIAVDTQLLVNLLDVLGPIGVSGFGNFSTEIVPECDCPQVVHELESFADIEGPVVWSENEPGKIVYAPPNYDNRKKIIGPLMNSILANAMGQPKDKLPGLFEAAYKSLTEKHVLFYLFDDQAQRGVESFGIAGRIEDFEADYLHINDANLGGRKSNLYVTQEVDQEIAIAKDGTIEKTVTITYKNPKEHDGWLNSVLPNWVRIYVPKGAELIEFEGIEDQEEPYEEFGKTVFAGFFELRPLGVVKVTVKYRLPFKATDEYRLFLQKQPGTDAPLYTIKVDKQEEEFFLKTDKEFKIAL